MNARQRCRERRQMRHREQCKKDDEIRLLRLSILRGYETRSTEDIIDELWGITSTKKQKEDTMNTLVNFISILKMGLNKTEKTTKRQPKDSQKTASLTAVCHKLILCAEMPIITFYLRKNNV